MRLELTTSTLARWRSTTELRPQRVSADGSLNPPRPSPQGENRKISGAIPARAAFAGGAMADKLAEIIATKHREVEALLPRAAHLRAAALQRNEFGGFRAALDRGPGRLGVIAEVKKASPSAGLIDPSFDPERQAKRYLEGGASCLSVLTDRDYFQGSLEHLAGISRFSNAPLLRKDFTIHEVQIHEASVAGADAILLIVAALDDDTLRKLHDEAKAFQLDVLVEVHDLREMERALELGADLIGVNNRNLRTFQVDLATTEQLAEEVPAEVLLVSESGIRSPEDARRVLEAGANAVLIGEALMRADDPSREIETYLELSHA
jgi:indole-3-glycerol phosphate synthase